MYDLESLKKHIDIYAIILFLKFLDKPHFY